MWATLTCKMGQTDLVFGMRSSGFVSRSMHTRLQVSVSAVTTCVTLVSIQRDRYTDTQSDRQTAF